MSHLLLSLASRSLTQPLLLRQNKILVPSAENRGNQSTASPLVICFTLLPSVFMVKRSWLPIRELDQTMVPWTFFPIAAMAAASSPPGVFSEPLGGAPETA